MPFQPLLKVKTWTVEFAELPQKYFISEKSQRGLRLNHGVMPWHYSVMGNMTARYLEANTANIWTLCHYLILPIQCPLSFFLFSLCHFKWLGRPAGISLFPSAFHLFYLLFCKSWSRAGSWWLYSLHLELPHNFLFDEQCEKHPVIKAKTTPIISLFHRSSQRCLEEFAAFLGPEAVTETTNW